MTKIELLELIGNGENSGVEFKRLEIRPVSGSAFPDLIEEEERFTVRLWK